MPADEGVTHGDRSSVRQQDRYVARGVPGQKDGSGFARQALELLHSPWLSLRGRLCLKGLGFDDVEHPTEHLRTPNPGQDLAGRDLVLFLALDVGELLGGAQDRCAEGP